MSQAILKKIEGFFSRYPLKQFDKGQIIIYAGNEPSGIFYLTTGQIRQYDINTRGDEIVVNVFKPPAFFPMSWAINKLPNQYFYDAVDKAEARIAPAEDVVKFVRGNVGVAFDLLSRVYRGAEGMQRRMAYLMGGNAKSRVLYELVNECQRFGTLLPDSSCMIAIHEDELAHRTGLTRETVNRELNKLKKAGLISINHKGITVKNTEELEIALGPNL